MASAQDTSKVDSVIRKKIFSELGIGLNTSNSEVTPFWMRSNKYGSIPLEGNSASFYAIIENPFKHDEKNKLFDWGWKLNGRINVGNTTQVIPLEAYVKARLSVFQLKVGRSHDREGLVDSLLSSGSFTLSGNALGVPKLELSIPEYFSVPGTSQFLAFKGNISYGWMGNTSFKKQKLGTNYHHLSFYGRLGRPQDKWKLYAAMNHDVLWGFDDEIAEGKYKLSKVEEFWYVITGKPYNIVNISKVGNHLGSIDVGASYNFRNFSVNAYRQFFYDKGAIGHLANLKDGLTGVVFENLRPKITDFYWRKLLVEFFYSKHQAGDYGAKKTPSGPEYYYNHAVYKDGFSYKGESLGTPLITPSKYARNGLINHPMNFFISTRVIATHLGFYFDWSDYKILLKGTIARHYGDYKTSGPELQWYIGKQITQKFDAGLFTPVNQFSGYAQVERNLKNKVLLGAEIGLDHGKLYQNSLGVSLFAKKQF